MKNRVAASHYACALFPFVDHDFGAAVELLEFWRRMHSNVVALRRYLAHPSVSAAEKREFIDGVCGGANEHVRRLLMLLVDRRRMSLLGDIVDEMRRLRNEAEEVRHLSVTSAQPLTSAERNNLLLSIARLTHRRLEASYAVDPSLIAGMVINVGKLRLDTSLKAKLEHLNRSLVLLAQGREVG